MKIELTEQQLNNLQVFLQRADLKGNEALAYVEIIQALNSPLDLEEDKGKDI